MNIIKVVTQQQLNMAFDIRLEVFVKEQGVPRELELDEYDESPVSCHHYLVVDDGKPIATGRWREYEPGVVKLQRIAVLQSKRGLGAGKFLIQGIEEEAKQLGYQETLLDAQCSAEVFYTKLGYLTESAEPFLDANIPHIRMRKRL